MGGYRDPLEATRRLFLLRQVVKMHGVSNESVLHLFAQECGYGHPSREDTRKDIDHLREQGCLTQEFKDGIRVVYVTEWGEDAAYGRVEVKGVQRTIWRRD